MADLVQPRLVNEPFSDPVLFLDFRFGRRALLFDLGYLTPLSTREIVRVSHVFVSHMHMDHFSGFDRLLRSKLYHPVVVHLVGPPGLGDAVQAKLRAYSWNLLDRDSVDFAIAATDWQADGVAAASLFRARRGFAREDADVPKLAPGVLLDDPDFHVEGTMLDHGIPSLAFAFQEKLRVNVHKSSLDELGLPVEPWLTRAKHLLRQGASADTTVKAGGREVSLGELRLAGALHIGPGQRVAYATDLAFTDDNVGRLVALARGADQLFIEAGYLDADAAIAASKRHLTAPQAGGIARAAGALHATPMHFSSRYLEREDELRAEFERHFASDGGRT